VLPPQRIGTIVKLPAADGHQLLKVLETGVDALLLAAAPDTETAIAAVEACRFPPIGSRGASTIVRGAGYSSAGMSFEALAARNDSLVIGVLVENAELVAGVEALANHDSIDFVFIGTADLALSMGVGDTATQQDLKVAIDHVIEVCGAAGKTLGMPMGHPPTR